MEVMSFLSDMFANMIEICNGYFSGLDEPHTRARNVLVRAKRALLLPKSLITKLMEVMPFVIDIFANMLEICNE